MNYDTATIAEIIYDYAVVRGDLSEPYARDQLVSIIKKRHDADLAEATAIVRVDLRDLVSDWQANATGCEPGDPVGQTWNDAASGLFDVLQRARA
jgi:hypothetical protein